MLWIITTIYIIHYIKKVQSDPTRSVVYGDEEVVKQAEDVALPEVTLRRILVLVIFFAAFVAISIPLSRASARLWSFAASS